MTVTKSKLIKIIQKETGIHKVDVVVFISVLLNTLKNSIEHGDRVRIEGFGTFQLQYRHWIYSKYEKLPYYYPVFTGHKKFLEELNGEQRDYDDTDKTYLDIDYF